MLQSPFRATTAFLRALGRDPADATRGQRIAGGILLGLGLLALSLVPR